MDFTGIARPDEFRVVTRAHVLAWRNPSGQKYMADRPELTIFCPKQHCADEICH
jgi:hypothetical protein